MRSFADYGIVLPNGKSSGEVATICPKCSHLRKEQNRKTKVLGVNLDKNVWRCNHCGWSGALPSDVRERTVYEKPVWRNNTELSDNVIKWFEKRKISQKTVQELKITEGEEWMPQRNKKVHTIQFNYFRDDELINIKFRDAAKNFKLYSGAELIPYNISSIKGSKTAYLVEGEMDVCAMVESGFKSVISCPNGANLKNNNLSWLDPIIDLFNDMEIVLCFDNDAAGRKLRDDVADRFGRERCSYVEFLDCKDANDCLINHGIDGIIRAINDKRNFPLEGVFTVADFSNEIDDMYENGLDSGVPLNIENFNLSIVKGYLTIITGIPSHGKSEWVDEMAVALRRHHNWSGAFYSPENRPTQLHFSKLSRRIIGKHWDGPNRIQPEEINLVKKWLDKKFWFIKPEKDFTLDGILANIREIQRRFGLDFFVIDAWNKLEHRETEDTGYIGKSLDKIVTFCEMHNVHCFLVAHPKKISKRQDGEYEVPTLYDISGSANFYNKADNGITVYRDKTTNKTIIFVQKVKFDHWGREGSSEYYYDIVTKRYFVAQKDTSNWITGEGIKNYFSENQQVERNVFLPNNEFDTPPF